MTPDALDALDRRLLDELQAAVPLVPDPLAELADRLNADPDDLLDRVAALKRGGIIRQVSAIFDTAALGYASSLVAARFEPDRLADGARVISGHPGVTHNYRREHEFNLWFTVAVPPASRLGLERTVELLGAESGARAVRMMPTLRLFKIGVRLGMTAPGRVASANRDAVVPDEPGAVPANDDAPPEGYTDADRAQAVRHPLTARDVALVRVLQEDLPVSRTPFANWARRAGVSVEELLASARRLLQRRQMRRFAAVLRHRAAGFAANAMGVWDVPDERVEQVGRSFAAFGAVSHCYLRPRWPDWPYNIFTMVHGRTRDDCERELDAMRRASGVGRMAVLYSTEEFKKTRLRYFTGEIEAWEAQRL